MVVPTSVDNDCLDAIDLMSEAGLELMDWQALLLECWMGVGPTGLWAAPTAGNEGPRQNGKTRVIQGRSASEMLLYGGTVIYTAQLQKTSTETFEEMASLFDSAALRKFIAKGGIRTALGREEVRLKNGAKMKFLARTRNGGNGQHGSLLIFDESQYLEPDEQGSFLAAISACRTKRGPQTIYNGNAPEERDYGLVFEKIRAGAIGGTSKLSAWTEWSSGESENVPDTSDRDMWERVNPSWGILIDPRTVENEYESQAAAQFAHQRLGWFKKRPKASSLVGEDDWCACSVMAAPDRGVRCFGVKFSPDGSRVCVAGSRHLAESDHVELIFDESMGRGTSWLSGWLCERRGTTACVAIDGKTGAVDLANKLTAGGFPKNAVKVMGTSEVAGAASTFVNSVRERTVTHLGTTGQRGLTDSVLSVTKRHIGDGYGFDGDNCTPAEAASLALYAGRTTKRNPDRKGIAG